MGHLQSGTLLGYKKSGFIVDVSDSLLFADFLVGTFKASLSAEDLWCPRLSGTWTGKN